MYNIQLTRESDFILQITTHYTKLAQTGFDVRKSKTSDTPVALIQLIP